VYRPDEKRPWGRRDIRRFALGVSAFGNGRYIKAKKEDIDEYVQDLGNSDCEQDYREKNRGDNLESNVVSPRIGHDSPNDKG
jgi:hypothetical protein